MKKRNLLLILVAAFCVAATNQSAQAQDYYETKHELALSYGAGSNSQVFGFSSEFVGLLFTGGKRSYDNHVAVGPIGVEYFYHTSKVVGVGVIGTYTHLSKDVMLNDAKQGSTRRNYVSLIPAVKLDWLRREKFGLYSKLGVGASYEWQHNETVDGTKEDVTKVLFTWQASLIGLEAGSTNVRGFLELGIGEQGVALVGLRYKF